MASGNTVRLKRIYDEPAPEDGYRVLVDRIWPRGLSHERARIDVALEHSRHDRLPHDAQS